MPGSLFVVATPIGNLEDITLRALRTLREVDVIAAEDTRRTAKLLAHYDIQKPVMSLREHNETRESAKLIERMQQGATVALVSDAGTPTISDPGTHLVAQTRAAGIRVIPIPGPSAITAALSAIGAPADRFVFLGFPPTSGLDRERWLEELFATQTTAVFYESPHRIRRTVDDVTNILAERQISICREVTKIHEELFNWNNKSIINETGEFVVVVHPRAHEAPTEADPAQVADLFSRITEISTVSDDEALAMVAGHFKTSPAKTRNLIKKGAIALKRRADTESRS